jgi:putative membrane protein
MKLFQVFIQDLKYFLKKPMLMITFFAVACIPILYSGFLIKGTWDPYGKLEKLPIAVVNLDKGATYQGKPMHVGQDFIHELKENPKFAWKFVDQEEAQAGMLDNHYYAKITIPATFSADAASLTGKNPKQAALLYESNSYYNFVAGQISENAIKELRTKLSENLTEAYTRGVINQFAALSKGLQTASDGASQLNKGTVQIDHGISQVRMNLAKLTAGAIDLNSGIYSLRDGSTKVYTGTTQLNTGASSLAMGINQFSAAGTKLEQGAVELNTGTKSLVTGIKSAKAGADQLTTGLQTSAEASKQLESGLATSVSSSENLSSGANQVADGLQQLESSHPELASDPQFQRALAASKSVASGAGQLSEGQKKLHAGSQKLSQGQQKLLTGSKRLSHGHQQLAQGANKLGAGQQRLANGLKQFNVNFAQIVNGSKQVSTGASQVNQGARQLHSGLVQLADGSDKLETGSKQLTAGTKPLSSGIVKLVDGSGQLANKLNNAADKTSTLKADNHTITLFSKPVTLKADEDRHIQTYGYGIAPYFLSLALFAGSLVFTTVFSARKSVVEGASGLKLFVSKFLTFVLMSLAQSLIACTILVFLLDIHVQSIPIFYGYTMLVGLTFMLFCQAMVSILDQIGRFIILLIMIFQLSSSAGTFPFELLPDWAKALNPWLPMTYSIRGFRDIISSGAYGDLKIQAVHLAIFLLVFVVLSFAYFFISRKTKTNRQLKPAVN